MQGLLDAYTEALLRVKLGDEGTKFRPVRPAWDVNGWPLLQLSLLFYLFLWSELQSTLALPVPHLSLLVYVYKYA